MNGSSIKKMTTMGVLIAISVILIISPLKFPFPPAPFLVYDAADVSIIIGGLIFGPAEGVILTVVTAVVQTLVADSGGGWIGCIMHIVATSALVCTASVIYFRKKTLKSAVIGLVFGSLAMTALMIPMNMVFYPLFANTPVNAVIKLIVPALLPFNLLKAGLNSIIALLLYKSTGRLLSQIALK
ncbi:MAG TPA: ECF transporter S component [Ruminiclostridium sp.]|nr:ECF transporter S component [Ruminiclostridium sp.]